MAFRYSEWQQAKDGMHERSHLRLKVYSLLPIAAHCGCCSLPSRGLSASGLSNGRFS